VAVALGAGFWKWSQFPVPEQTYPPGVEKWIPTICAQCTGGCGILVRVIDGWAVNIAGILSIPSTGEPSAPRELPAFRVFTTLTVSVLL